MKLGVLTSSRADYGIYTPLLKVLSEDNRFDLELIVFGMHLDRRFGYTAQQVQDDNFGKMHQMEGMSTSDEVVEITSAYGELIKNFSQFWAKNKYDWVIALGDRFEMSAAIQSTIPFEIKVAHLHGGETTLGAIDNIYRHQITIASKLHFVATETFKERVSQITGESSRIFNVGALSLDNVVTLKTPGWEEVCSQLNIPCEAFVLVTFHPETVTASQNELFSKEAYAALEKIAEKLQVIITLTNADAGGSWYIKQFKQLETVMPNRITLIDNFGRVNYFAAMKACKFLLGNTSSGIIEAASFGKFVVNVGNRQEGRLQSNNVLNVAFEQEKIIEGSFSAFDQGEYLGENIYYKPNTAQNIKEILAANANL